VISVETVRENAAPALASARGRQLIDAVTFAIGHRIELLGPRRFGTHCQSTDRVSASDRECLTDARRAARWCFGRI